MKNLIDDLVLQGVWLGEPIADATADVEKLLCETTDPAQRSYLEMALCQLRLLDVGRRNLIQVVDNLRSISKEANPCLSVLSECPKPCGS